MQKEKSVNKKDQEQGKKRKTINKKAKQFRIW